VSYTWCSIHSLVLSSGILFDHRKACVDEQVQENTKRLIGSHSNIKPACINGQLSIPAQKCMTVNAKKKCSQPENLKRTSTITLNKPSPLFLQVYPEHPCTTHTHHILRLFLLHAHRLVRSIPL
jgi:hypothetical protein